jgi:Putative peptidoglycan binding domain
MVKRSIWRPAAARRMHAVPILALTATASLAQTPAPDYDGRDATFTLLPGSFLRRGETQADKIAYTVWDAIDIKGAGRCSVESCPVTFNGEALYARRLCLEIKDTRRLPPRIASVLRRGDTGGQVRLLQEALREAGSDVAIDGTYGRSTEQAVRDFQAKRRLKIDGIAGRTTLRELGA